MARKTHFNFLHFKIYFLKKVEENIYDVYLDRRSVLDIWENLHIERRAAGECVRSRVLCQHNWCWRTKINRTINRQNNNQCNNKIANKIEQRTSL